MPNGQRKPNAIILRVDGNNPGVVYISALLPFLIGLRKDVEAVCGLGQGRYLSRSVAAFLDVPHHVCKSAVAHRKGTYILEVAQRWLENYCSNYHTLLIRSRHALDKRGSKSFEHLRKLREDLGDQVMLTFVLGLMPGMQHVLAQITLQSQDVADLAWQWWRAARGEGGSLVMGAMITPSIW